MGSRAKFQRFVVIAMSVCHVKLKISQTALRNYEPRVIHYTNQLLVIIRAANGNPIDASMQFNLYSFDVMGNLAFGQDFEMIQSQKLHPSM